MGKLHRKCYIGKKKQKTITTTTTTTHICVEKAYKKRKKKEMYLSKEETLIGTTPKKRFKNKKRKTKEKENDKSMHLTFLNLQSAAQVFLIFLLCLFEIKLRMFWLCWEDVEDPKTQQSWSIFTAWRWACELIIDPVRNLECPNSPSFLFNRPEAWFTKTKNCARF